MSTRRTFLTGALALSGTALGGTEPATAAARRAALTTQDWMAGLADATPVQRLTIPGTHDSGARYGGPWTECQNTTVAEQLSAGVLRGERSGGPPDLRRLRRHHCALLVRRGACGKAALLADNSRVPGVVLPRPGLRISSSTTHPGRLRDSSPS